MPAIKKDQRMRFIKLLFINKSLIIGNRHVRPRFFYILFTLFLIIFFVFNLDKLIPETFFTSPYWQAVACGE